MNEMDTNTWTSQRFFNENGGFQYQSLLDKTKRQAITQNGGRVESKYKELEESKPEGAQSKHLANMEVQSMLQREQYTLRKGLRFSPGEYEEKYEVAHAHTVQAKVPQKKHPVIAMPNVSLQLENAEFEGNPESINSLENGSLVVRDNGNRQLTHDSSAAQVSHSRLGLPIESAWSNDPLPDTRLTLEDGNAFSDSDHIRRDIHETTAEECSSAGNAFSGPEHTRRGTHETASEEWSSVDPRETSSEFDSASSSVDSESSLLIDSAVDLSPEHFQENAQNETITAELASPTNESTPTGKKKTWFSSKKLKKAWLSRKVPKLRTKLKHTKKAKANVEGVETGDLAAAQNIIQEDPQMCDASSKVDDISFLVDSVLSLLKCVPILKRSMGFLQECLCQIRSNTKHLEMEDIDLVLFDLRQNIRLVSQPEVENWQSLVCSFYVGYESSYLSRSIEKVLKLLDIAKHIMPSPEDDLEDDIFTLLEAIEEGKCSASPVVQQYCFDAEHELVRTPPDTKSIILALEPLARVCSKGVDKLDAKSFDVTNEILATGEFGDVLVGLFKGQPAVAKRWASQSSILVQVRLRSVVSEWKFLSSHPNIASVYAVDVDALDKRILFIERGDYTLHDIIHKVPSLPSLGLWVRVLHELAKGLSFLHSRGMPHGDLKPSNILVDKNFENIKLCDIGFRNVKLTMEMEGGRRGNVYAQDDLYLAPECKIGRSVTFKGDVFGFGVILWEMLHRQKPTHKIRDSLCHMPISPEVADLPLLNVLMTTCCDFSPSKRPSASNLCSDLGSEVKLFGKLESPKPLMNRMFRSAPSRSKVNRKFQIPQENEMRPFVDKLRKTTKEGSKKEKFQQSLEVLVNAIATRERNMEEESGVVHERRRACWCLGASPLIVLGMITHKQDPVVQWLGCKSLRFLSRTFNVGMAGDIAEQGGITVVLEALNRFPSNMFVQRWGCAAMTSFSMNAELNGQMLKLGAAHSIQDSMRYFPKDAGLAIEACSAICNFASRQDNALSLIHAGVLDDLSLALQSHLAEAGVLEKTIAALRNLAIHDAAKQQLLSNGAFLESVELAMCRHKTDDRIQTVACGLLCNLFKKCKPGSECASSILAKQKRFTKPQWMGKIGKAILRAMGVHLHDAKVQENGCAALCSIVSHIPPEKSVSWEPLGVTTILETMKVHCKEASVQRYALLAIRYMSMHCSKSVKATLLKKGLAERLTDSMRTHPYDQNILHLGSGLAVFLAASGKLSSGELYDFKVTAEESIVTFPKDESLVKSARCLLNILQLLEDKRLF